MQIHGAPSIELANFFFFLPQEHKDGVTPDEKKMKTLLAARRKLMAQLIIELTNVYFLFFEVCCSVLQCAAMRCSKLTGLLTIQLTDLFLFLMRFCQCMFFCV